MSRTVKLLVIAGLWITGLASHASAQTAESRRPDAAQESVQTPREAQARRSFEEGRAALEWGNFEDALRLFERAYDLSGRPEMLYNIGTVLDKMRRDADAARYFERYLDVQPEATNRPAVEARLAALRARMFADRQAAPVPSPTQVAQDQAAAQQPMAVTVAPSMPATEAPSRSDSVTPLRKKWWFWTGLVVVAGGAAAAAVLLTRDRETIQEPLVGSQDAFTQALWSR
jgi:tetratricopeptide (TPR) repeat protein